MVALLSVALLVCGVAADESPTVLAVAKVKGVEKTVEGKVYALVVVRVAHVRQIWEQMSTGVGFQYFKPTVQFDLEGKGVLPSLPLTKEEQRKWGPSGPDMLYAHLRWVNFSERSGIVNARYGLAFEGEFGKSPPQPLSVPIAEFPVVAAETREELRAAIGKLVPKPEEAAASK